MAEGKLSVRKIEAAKCAGKFRALFGDGNGLHLQVTPTGAKSFVFRFRFAGKRRDLGLGPVHTVSLAEAREAALQARKLLREGIDPLDARRGVVSERRAAAASTKTFDEVFALCVAAKEPGWRDP